MGSQTYRWPQSEKCGFIDPTPGLLILAATAASYKHRRARRVRVARSQLWTAIARNTLTTDTYSAGICARNFTNIFAWKMFLTMYWRWETTDFQNLSSYARRQHHHTIDRTHYKTRLRCWTDDFATNMKKALRETQTLRTGCNKAEPKIFAPPQTPFLGGGRRTAKI